MDAFERLTKRQLAVYEFIREKMRARGYGPTVREIATNFDISSPNGVVCHLKALEKKGLITRDPGRSRAIELALEPCQRGFPLAGRIAAGMLHEAIEQNEWIDFSDVFDPKKRNLFVLEVDDDSMIDEQIADGDYVIVRKARKARRGQIVVASTGDNEATLKRYFPEKKRVRLQPANKRMKSIYVKNVRITGVVVGVVRKV